MNYYSIILNKSAYIDFEEIYKYIYTNFNSKSIADKIIDKISNKILFLKEFPYAFQKLEKYKFDGQICRRVIVGNYSIIYYILEGQKKVVIVYIYYNKRNFFNF